MTLTKRRLLYISFIVLFLVITPTILFYAAGYNFNLNNRAIERTGILTIKTEPRDAQVHLGEGKKFNWLYNVFYGDGELTTPLKLRNLLPDEYEVTITKDGYFDYRKKIELLPGHTVVLDEILLLKKSEAVVVIGEDVINSKISPDQEKLAVVTDGSIFIVSLDNAENVEIPLDFKFSLASDFDINWSANSKKILLTIGDFPIYNVNTLKKEIDVIKFLPNVQDIIRFSDTDDNKIFALRNNRLWQIDLLQKSTKIIPLLIEDEHTIKDFIIKDKNFYVLENTNFNSHVVIYDSDNYNIIKNISIPSSQTYQFFNINKELVYIYDNKHKLVYIIDSWALLPIKDTINNVREMVVNDNFILYWNDFEIWLYNSKTKAKNLLTRMSKKIDKAILEKNYIIYNTTNGIKSIERGDDSYFNLTEILDWKETKKILMNSNSDLIYFVSWLDNKRVLYSIGIK